MKSDVGLRKLALYVIKRQLKDAIGTDTRYKDEAIEWLSTYNDDFIFWCNVAELNPDIVYKQVHKIHTNPEYWINILKKLDKLEKSTDMYRKYSNYS